MIQTDKPLLEFLKDYQIAPNFQLNSDFKRCFKGSETRGYSDEENFSLQINAQDYEFELYISPMSEVVELFVKDVLTGKSNHQRYPITWIQENHNNLSNHIFRMLLNLT